MKLRKRKTPLGSTLFQEIFLEFEASDHEQLRAIEEDFKSCNRERIDRAGDALIDFWIRELRTTPNSHRHDMEGDGDPPTIQCGDRVFLLPCKILNLCDTFFFEMGRTYACINRYYVTNILPCTTTSSDTWLRPSDISGSESKLKQAIVDCPDLALDLLAKTFTSAEVRRLVGLWLEARQAAEMLSQSKSKPDASTKEKYQLYHKLKKTKTRRNAYLIVAEKFIVPDFKDFERDYFRNKNKHPDWFADPSDDEHCQSLTR